MSGKHYTGERQRRRKAATPRHNAPSRLRLISSGADRLLRYVASLRHDLLRVGVQSSIAVAATYAVVSLFGLPHMTWAVIASLYTVGRSADASLGQALGHVGGALLGAALGLIAGWTIGWPIVALVIAATVATLAATLSPILHYAAVTAAIIALDPVPSIAEALVRTQAILLGAVMAALAGFLALPIIARRRAIAALQRALGRCERLFELAAGGLKNGEDRREQDAVHAAFLQDIDAARTQTRTSLFGRRIANGAGLKEATDSVEGLWYSLVILDRAVSDECSGMSDTGCRTIEREIRSVQSACAEEIRSLGTALDSDATETAPAHRFRAAIETSRLRLIDQARGRPEAEQQAYAAVGFALREIETRVRSLSESFRLKT